MSPGGNRLQILVPGSDETEDLYRRIADALRILTALERRSGGDLVREIMQLSSDVILWRVPIQDDAGIPLDIAARVVKGMEELLVYGATNEIEEPRPAVGRRTKLAQEYLSSCTLGHTRPGSFIFEFTSPVNSVVSDALHTANAPFGRRVVERVVRGLLSVNSAAKELNPGPIVKHYESGFNANQCVALADMIDDTGYQFQFLVNWSPEIPAAKNLVSAQYTNVEASASTVLREAAKELRNVQPKTTRTLIGRILRLGDSSTGQPRSVVLSSVVDGQDRRVSFTLSHQDYLVACDAHRDERTVQVSGQLVKEGRKTILENPVGFKLR
jgi:hypothetical protein